ncbi:esterase-like activity of phytase family protein [Pelagovum pacificum]|uniref:Esterase-like activity of phytase family protein n=1 Tax=Pelagovum pacificum TaxID=2588711 RepID=A0A5C5G9D9_9RHOB|nr:esterase-like activity of phytase family protein [Pelagovum pacificum]QQA42205.1 esterase-like activity of phytase family protein [Pelagovum pacificum]TNY31291.1 esterase-like activity of phytase family protein [Pelagovum pacificum]
MTIKTILLASSALTLLAGAAAAQEMSFNRIASFATTGNSPDAEETSAEIIDVSDDGMTLIYTDSPAGVVGMIDITDPANPVAGGEVEMDGGEPTSVAVDGMSAFIGVNTSESYTDPSGFLFELDMESGEEVARCDLGGQPDSVAIAKDASFVTVAIENERDEDAGDGRVGQMPAGFVVIVPLADGALQCDAIITADVTGLADIAPEDPEPEFVDTNEEGEIVVTMQENNHIVVLSSEGEVLNHFSAGTVSLDEIDATEDDALSFTESLADIPREPDSVKWIGDTHFATANEGDMDGGSRGWTIFSQAGEVIYDSGNSFEHALIQIGHYPEGRSENKGVEPESVTFDTFGETPMVFVGSERGSAVGVYDVTDPTAPELTQILPSGIGPEGYVTIPERNLLVSANETDLGPDGGARAHVMIFEYGEGAPAYPQLTSEGADELIGWGAISGMVAGEDGIVYAVNDSFYQGSPTIYTIDTTQTPARITDALPIRSGDHVMDMEGITLDGEGGFWVATEGNLENGRFNALYHVSAEGEVLEEVKLPAELEAVQTNSGFEGVTMIDGVLWAAQQRPWSDDAENTVKLLSYDPASGEWGAVAYPLEVPETGWIGLSEIVAHGDYVYLIERDNQIGEAVAVKHITRVPLAEMQPVAIGEDYPVVSKEMVYDVAPDLLQLNGYAQDKVEGLAIFEDGTAWVSTDNDGVDDHSGETLFWQVGPF